MTPTAPPAGAPLEHLEGGEAVDVHSRGGRLHRLHQVQVVLAVELGMDATLQADLGGSSPGGFDHPLDDLLQGEQIGLAPEVERERAFGEAAEPAPVGADVGVVDVPVPDEGHHVAHRGPAQTVGRLAHRGDLQAPGTEEGEQLLFSRFLAQGDTIEDFADGAVRHGAGGGQQCRRTTFAPGVPRRRARPDGRHLRAAAGVRPGGETVREHRSGVVPGQSLGIGAIEDGEVQRRLDPRLGAAGVGGADGEPGGERETLGLRSRPQGFHLGRFDAAPVVYTGGEQRARVAGLVRRHLQRYALRQDQAGERHRLEELGPGDCRGRWPHDDCLEVTVARLGFRQPTQDLDAVVARLARPDGQADGQRDAERSGGLDRVDLVGHVTLEAPQEQALARCDGPEGNELVGGEQPDVGVRQQPGLVEHQLAGPDHVVDGGVVAVPGEPLGGAGMPPLGLPAHAENGLVASGFRSPPGDGQDLFGIEERLFARPWHPGRVAVSAGVLAQPGQRDNDLGRPGDPPAVHLVPNGGRFGQQRIEGEDGQVTGRGDRRHGHDGRGWRRLRQRTLFQPESGAGWNITQAAPCP